MKKISSLLFAASAIAGCVSVSPRQRIFTDEKTLAVADMPKITATDRTILRLVISDWFKDPESEGEVWPARTNGLLVVFAPSDTFTYAVQIAVDASPRVIPADVMTSFTNRNAHAFDIRSVHPIGEGVKIVERYERYWIDFEKAYPDAKGYADISVPGFSFSGDQAVVRLSGGPSHHGFTCTYFLERKHDACVIKWKKTAYYA